MALTTTTNGVVSVSAETSLYGIVKTTYNGETKQSAYVDAGFCSTADSFSELFIYPPMVYTSAQTVVATSNSELECFYELLDEYKMFLSKFPELVSDTNTLLVSLSLVLQQINEFPPIFTELTPCQIKDESMMLFYGAAAQLFETMAIKEALNFVAPTINSSISMQGTHLNEYLNQANYYYTNFHALATQYKYKLNINGLYITPMRPWW